MLQELLSSLPIPPIVLAGLAIVIGLVLLLWSADRFIAGAEQSAKILGVPPLLIGILIVGLGTSAPEIVVSSIASWQGNSGIVLGNAYGSNITNIALILGMTALVVPITTNKKVVWRELPLLIILTCFAAWQISYGVINRLDAGILLLLFVAVMVFIVLQDVQDGQEEEHEINMSLAAAIFWILFGLVILVISSKVLVWGAVEIAKSFGVSDLLIGLTIVALGTSLPELASSIIAARKHEHDIALGNIVGSNLFNLLCVVGIAGVIRPLNAEPAVLMRDVPVMLILTVMLLLFCLPIFSLGKRAQIGRIKGGLFVLSYISYMGYLIYEAMQQSSKAL